MALQELRCPPSPTSPLSLTARHPVLGVHIARVRTFAAVDQVPEATLAVDDVVTPTTVLLVVVVTSADLVRTSVAKHHVVPTKGVDAITRLGAYNLLAPLCAHKFFGQGHSAGRDQRRG